MGEETDFFRLMGAIAGKAGLFPAAGHAVRKAVNEIVRAQLAAEGTGLDQLRQIRAVLGPDAFAEALDGVPPPKAKALLARLDPYAAVPTQPGERIQALLGLADGSRAPGAPAEKPARKAGSKKTAAPKEPASKDLAPKEPTPTQPTPTQPVGAPAGKEPAPKEPVAAAPARPRRRVTGRAALRVSEER